MNDRARDRGRVYLLAGCGWSWALAAGYLLFAPGAVTAQQALSWQKVLAEAAPKWEQYAAFYSTLEFAMTTERQDLGPGKNPVTGTTRGRYKWCDENFFLQVESWQKKSYTAEVTAANQRYWFSLRRSRDDKPWVVQEVARRNKEDKNNEERFQPLETARLGLFLDHPMQSLPVSIKWGNLTPTDVREVRDGGRTLVRVTFTFSAGKAKRDVLRGGWFLLDPETNWLIRNGEYDVVSDVANPDMMVKRKYRFEFKPGPGGQPLPVKDWQEATYTTKGRATLTQKFVSEFEATPRASIPESEFTLAAFGLPEPFDVKHEPPPRWYLWLGVGGVACLACGAVVRRVLRRRAVVAGAG